MPCSLRGPDCRRCGAARRSFARGLSGSWAVPLAPGRIQDLDLADRALLPQQRGTGAPNPLAVQWHCGRMAMQSMSFICRKVLSTWCCARYPRTRSASLQSWVSMKISVLPSGARLCFTDRAAVWQPQIEAERLHCSTGPLAFSALPHHHGGTTQKPIPPPHTKQSTVIPRAGLFRVDCLRREGLRAEQGMGLGIITGRLGTQAPSSVRLVARPGSGLVGARAGSPPAS